MKFETFSFHCTQAKYVKVAVDHITNPQYKPDGLTPLQVSTMLSDADTEVASYMDRFDALNVARGELEASAATAHDAAVDVYACMKSCYRKNRGVLASIRRLTKDDRTSRQTLLRVKSLSRRWAQLPAPPGGGIFQVGAITMAAFNLLRDDLDQKINTFNDCTSQFVVGQVGLREMDENIAGFVTAAGLEDSNDAIQRMWEVHCMAHIYAARAVLPSMIARGEGYLLNTASAAGLLTQIGSMAYSITKAAAISLGEWLAVTHHHQGIRISVLCPQAVATNIVRNSPDFDEDTGGGIAGGLEGGVASGDGVLTADQVAQACLDAIRDERFLVLPHPEVATYVQRKATDRDRWLAGMRRFQTALHPDGDLPGNAIAPKL